MAKETLQKNNENFQILYLKELNKYAFVNKLTGNISPKLVKACSQINMGLVSVTEDGKNWYFYNPADDYCFGATFKEMPHIKEQGTINVNSFSNLFMFASSTASDLPLAVYQCPQDFLHLPSEVFADKVIVDACMRAVCNSEALLYYDKREAKELLKQIEDKRHNELKKHAKLKKLAKRGLSVFDQDSQLISEM